MPSLDSFRTARWLRTLNLVLQALLFLSLFGCTRDAVSTISVNRPAIPVAPSYSTFASFARADSSAPMCCTSIVA